MVGGRFCCRPRVRVPRSQGAGVTRGASASVVFTTTQIEHSSRARRRFVRLTPLCDANRTPIAASCAACAFCTRAGPRSVAAHCSLAKRRRSGKAIRQRMLASRAQSGRLASMSQMLAVTPEQVSLRGREAVLVRRLRGIEHVRPLLRSRRSSRSSSCARMLSGVRVCRGVRGGP